MDSNARRCAQRELEKRNETTQHIPTKTDESEELEQGNMDEEADDIQTTKIDNEEADGDVNHDEETDSTDISTNTPIVSNRSKDPRSNTEANEQELKKRKGIGTVNPEFELNDKAGTSIQHWSVRAKHNPNAPENYLQFFAVCRCKQYDGH